MNLFKFRTSEELRCPNMQIRLMPSILGKLTADDILKYFAPPPPPPPKTGFDISCKLSPMETICMKCQSLFSEESKNDITSLSSTELAKRVVKVKLHIARTISERTRPKRVYERRSNISPISGPSYHYENTPIQIYWKFYHQKMKIFRWKILIFFIFLLKT